MITLKAEQTMMNTGAFGLIVSNGIKYLIPAWIAVPMDTEYNDVIVDMPEKVIEEKLVDKKWEVIGSKGVKYTVQRKNNIYTCDCPSSMFHKSKPCKHITQCK